MPRSFSIHFVHGSIPKKGFGKGEKVPGGLLGGHIYIQLGDAVYGFEPVDRSRIHLFPKKRKNSIYKKEFQKDWKESTIDRKMTSIEIPADSERLSCLHGLLETYCRKVPYDYAVFGMRCGSSTYQILSMVGIFPYVSGISSMLRIPVPRILRKKMLEMARLKNLPVTKQKGSNKRIWE